MAKSELLNKVRDHMRFLCEDITNRSVGSPGNLKATSYFKDVIAKNDWMTEETLLEVLDWKSGNAELVCGDERFHVLPSPYSLPTHVNAQLKAAESLDEVETSDLSEKILLLHGDIAREQIMPKNFVFYNPEEHQKVISALERSGVKALVCATGRNPSLAGGVYPFPLFEDGDFDIPSVYMKDTEGEKLLKCIDKMVCLRSEAERIPSVAYNITGKKIGSSGSTIVISAHIDAKKGSPGAIDNASGVAVLLMLSELLKDYRGRFTIELAAFNGEDYYSAAGQMKYIEQNNGNFNDVFLNINIDGAGYFEGRSFFSPFDLPYDIARALERILADDPDIEEGPKWYQGDHSIFLQYGCPAIAVSSSFFIENIDTQDITHTPKDNLDIVSNEKILSISMAIYSLILMLDKKL